jgi:hypothetical protein
LQPPHVSKPAISSDKEWRRIWEYIMEGMEDVENRKALKNIWNEMIAIWSACLSG